MVGHDLCEEVSGKVQFPSNQEVHGNTTIQTPARLSYEQ